MDLMASVAGDGMLAPCRPVVVLYSGGADSSCLLDVAVRIAGPGAVTALHVNYGVRESAGDDERHCARTCEHLGVPLEVVRAADAPTRASCDNNSQPAVARAGHGHPQAAAARDGRGNLQPADTRAGAGNLQAWARDLRYRAAHELARARDADVAAAHTATDQVETILYRLASSPSRRALLGMRPRDGRLIRPLLGFWRASTEAHCRARELAWREDETNATGAYARGRIRHGLAPALAAIHPAAEANVLALAQILRDEAAVLDEMVDSVLGGGTQIELSALRDLAPALRRLVVQRLADAAVGRPAAGVGRRADEIAALPEHGIAALDCPGAVRATVRRGVLTFAPTPGLGAPVADGGGAQRVTTGARSAHPPADETAT